MDAPLPTGAQDGLGWTPFLPQRPSLSDELSFARRVYPLSENTAADFIKRKGLVESWHGGEHTVFLTKNDPEHVYKMSDQGSGAGFFIASSTQGDKLGLTRSTLRRYIQRMKLTNRSFGDDMKVLGVVWDEGDHVQKLVHRQKYRDEQESTREEIAAAMRKAGFRPLKDDNITNHMLAGSTWYHPKNNILVGDCHPRNFRTVAGEAVPIDIIIAEPEGAMLKFAKANVAKS
jgi:hypothetical protein